MRARPSRRLWRRLPFIVFAAEVVLLSPLLLLWLLRAATLGVVIVGRAATLLLVKIAVLPALRKVLGWCVAYRERRAWRRFCDYADGLRPLGLPPFVALRIVEMVEPARHASIDAKLCAIEQHQQPPKR